MWNRKTALMLVALLVPLGGCASLAENALNLPSGVLTTSVQNPVSRDTLLRVESGLRVAVAGLQTYKNYCERQPVGDRCDAIVARLQGYSRQSRPLVRQLRVFVRKNDQVNAQIVFTTLRGIFTEFRAVAAQEGIAVPNLGV